MRFIWLLFFFGSIELAHSQTPQEILDMMGIKDSIEELTIKEIYGGKKCETIRLVNDTLGSFIAVYRDSSGAALRADQLNVPFGLESVACGPAIRFYKERSLWYMLFHNGRNKRGQLYGVSREGDTIFYRTGASKHNNSYDSAYTFYSNGKIREVKTFARGYRVGLTKTYYSNGKRESKGKYTKVLYVDSNYCHTYSDISIDGSDSTDTFTVVNYFKKGLWFYYDENGKLSKLKWHKLRKKTTPYTDDFIWNDGYMIQTTMFY